MTLAKLTAVSLYNVYKFTGERLHLHVRIVPPIENQEHNKYEIRANINPLKE